MGPRDHLGELSMAKTIKITDVEIGRIRENPDNVRTVLTGLEGLAASIRSQGLQHPIVVHRKFERVEGVQDLELVDGARRLAAHHIIGAATIQAEVRPYMEPDEILLHMIASTFREDPDAAGMQVAVRKLRDRHAMSAIQIAERLGTSVGQVQAWLRGNGKVPEVALVVPGGVPTPARPVPPVTPAAAAAATVNGRVRRGSARTPTIRASRVFSMLEEYDAGKLDEGELAARLRGALGGWRPA